MSHKLAPLLEGQQTKTITLRLPIELYTRLLALATKEHRTIQGQLLHILDGVLVPHDEGSDRNA